MKSKKSVAHRLGRVLETVTRQSGRLSTTPEYGSWLLGKVNESQPRRRVRIQVILTFFILFTNLIGIAVATVLVAFVFPVPSVFTDVPAWLTFVVAPAYMRLALALGTFWVTRRIVQFAAVGDRGTDTGPHRPAQHLRRAVAGGQNGARPVGCRHGAADRRCTDCTTPTFIPRFLFAVGFPWCRGGHRLLPDHRVRAASGRRPGTGSRSPAPSAHRGHHGPDHDRVAARFGRAGDRHR